MILKFLHIGLIFSGIALIYGTEILLHRIGRTGDTRAIRSAFASARTVAGLGPALFWIGVGFGIAAGVVNGYNLLAPWLLGAYVLVAGLLVAGIAVTMPWMMRVGSLAAAAPDGPPPPELTAALHDRRTTAVLYASIVVDFVILWLMVFKPGS